MKTLSTLLLATFCFATTFSQTYLLKNFEDSSVTSGGWTMQNVSGSIDWKINNQGSGQEGTYYAICNNYVSGVNNACETWLISPSLDLSVSTDPVLSFINAYKYFGAALELHISTDYSGGLPSTGTWTPLTFTLSSGNFAWVTSGNISLSAYKANNVHIAFKYTGTSSDGSAWEMDNVVVKEPSGPLSLSITAIQGGVATSPYVNQTVITKGAVTAYATYKHPTDPNKDYRSYFLQDGDSAWSGIWVSDTINYLNVANGDTVTITADVEEFFNYTRLKNITSFQKSVGLSQPVPIMVSTQSASDEKYEGVLVEVTNAVVIDTAGITYGNFMVNDGTDSLLVDNIMYGPSNGPFLNDVLNLKGCMFYTYGKRYLLPRKPSDFTWLNSIEEEDNSMNVSVYPNPNNGSFTIEFEPRLSDIGHQSVVKIYNILGEMLLEKQLTANHNQLSTTLLSGIYNVQVVSNGNLMNRKLVVTN